MLKTVKVIFGSRIFRLLFSAALIFLAFRKVNIIRLLGELRMVPGWFLLLVIVYFVISMTVGACRWMLLVLDKPSWKDVKNFLNAVYSGSFYSLFFPSAIGGDLVKWLPLSEKYPQISKTRLASSVLIDRVIGLSAFALMAFISVCTGKILRFPFPDYLFWLFLVLFVGVVVFYVLVFTLDFERFFGKYKVLRKILDILDVLKEGNKKRIFTCLFISIVAEPVWILPVWFYSLIFHAGMSLLSVFVFVPVINLIIVLPISFAGFGARENLFILFFSQLGLSQEKILLVSTFTGIVGILNALLGGLVSLI